jgi:hypothetical protein
MSLGDLLSFLQRKTLIEFRDVHPNVIVGR